MRSIPDGAMTMTSCRDRMPTGETQRAAFFVLRGVDDEESAARASDQLSDSTERWAEMTTR